MKNVTDVSLVIALILIVSACTTPPVKSIRENSRQVSKQLLADAIERGQFDLAVDIYRQLPPGPHEPTTAFNGGIALYYIGERVEAERIFKWLTDNYPASPEGVFGLAWTRYLNADPTQAIAVLNSHKDVAPYHASTVNMLALCLDLLGRHSDAQEIYSQIVIKYPDSREAALLNSSYSYLAIKDLKRAKRQLARINTSIESPLSRLVAKNRDDLRKYRSDPFSQ